MKWDLPVAEAARLMNKNPRKKTDGDSDALD